MLQKFAWIVLLLSAIWAWLIHQSVSQGGVTFDSNLQAAGLTGLAVLAAIFGLLFQKIPRGKKRSTYARWGLLLILSFVVFLWHGANMQASLTNHRRWWNQLSVSATQSASVIQTELVAQSEPATDRSMDDLPNRGAE